MTEPPDRTGQSAPPNTPQPRTSELPDEWDQQRVPPPRSPAFARRTAGPLAWRIPAAIIILALVVAPGAMTIFAARGRYANLVGTGLVLWVALAGLGLVVVLAMIYVVSYVVSAAWHDAQNSRHLGDR